MPTQRRSRKPAPPPPVDDYLTVAEFAEIVGFHPGAIRKALTAGAYQGSRKVGPLWLIPRSWAVDHPRAPQGRPRKEEASA